MAANWSHFVFPLRCRGTRLKVQTWHVHNVGLFSMNRGICVHCIHARSASTPRWIQRAHSTTSGAALLPERWTVWFQYWRWSNWNWSQGQAWCFTYLPSLSTPHSFQLTFDHIHALRYNEKLHASIYIHVDCATQLQLSWLLMWVISFSLWDVMGHV